MSRVSWRDKRPARRRERSCWLRTESGQALGDCLAPGAAANVFDVDSELEVDPASTSRPTP